MTNASPLEVLGQRIKHHEAEAVNHELMFEELRKQLDVELKLGDRTGPEQIQVFVRALEMIERLRATNRAVRNELECLRVLMGG